MPLDVLPPPFLASLRRGGMVRVPRTHQFLGTPVEQLVAPDGDRALALVPVVVDGVLIGIAGFAAAVGSTWEQGDIDLLQLVAQGVARTVERKRVDGALHAAEARFRAMCDASPLGIFLAAQNGDGLYLNPAGQRIIGLSAEEMAGRGWMNALHPEDRARVVAHWDTAVEARDRLHDADPSLRPQERRGALGRGARDAARRPAPRRQLARHPRGRHRPAARRAGAPGPAGAHRGGARRGRGGTAGGGGRARRRRRDPVAHLGRVHRARPRRPLHLRERPGAGAVRTHARRDDRADRLGGEPAARRRPAAAARSSRPSRSSGRSPSRRSAAAVCSRCGSTRRRRACRSSSRTSPTASGTRSS